MACKCSKVGYPDKKAAEGELNKLRAKHGKEAPSRCYRCPDSNVWHLTSDKKDRGIKPGKLMMPERFRSIINKQKTTMDNEEMSKRLLESMATDAEKLIWGSAMEEPQGDYGKYIAGIDPVQVAREREIEVNTGNRVSVYKKHDDGTIEDVTPAPDVYKSLEEIIDAIITYAGIRAIPVVEKLQRTVESGAYIQKDGTC